MLRINDSQMAALDNLAEERFEGHLVSFVRERIPAATAAMPADQLRETVATHAAAARSFGLQSQAGIAQFVCLCFMPGPPFYENEMVKSFLALPRIPAEAKVRCLANCVAQELPKALGRA